MSYFAPRVTNPAISRRPFDGVPFGLKNAFYRKKKKTTAFSLQILGFRMAQRMGDQKMHYVIMEIG